MENSNVIYSIPCNDCNGVYVGETNQCLKNRVKQHINDIKNGKNNTALSSHVVNENHNLDIDNIKILNYEKNLRKRKFLESMYINGNNNCVYYRQDTDLLPDMYKHVVLR